MLCMGYHSWEYIIVNTSGINWSALLTIACVMRVSSISTKIGYKSEYEFLVLIF